MGVDGAVELLLEGGRVCRVVKVRVREQDAGEGVYLQVCEAVLHGGGFAVDAGVNEDAGAVFLEQVAVAAVV